MLLSVLAYAPPSFVYPLAGLTLFLIAVVGFMGMNVDDSRDCGRGPRAGTHGERRKRLGERRGERGRDLQTNLITSLQNGITLLALELLTSPKESEQE